MLYKERLRDATSARREIEMLIDLMTGEPVERVPYEGNFRLFMSRLSPDEISSIKSLLNQMIDGTDIQTSGWMPGADWRGTPFQSIFEKAARFNPDAAGHCFGQMVREVFIERPETWTFGHFYKDGDPIGSSTYFKVG